MCLAEKVLTEQLWEDILYLLVTPHTADILKRSDASLAFRFSFWFSSIINDQSHASSSVLIQAMNFLFCSTVAHFVDTTEFIRFDPEGISSGF